MHPLTFYSDTFLTRSLARTYGDRLEHMAESSRMYIVACVSVALYSDTSVIDVMSELDSDGDEPEAFVVQLQDLFLEIEEEEFEEVIIGLLQAVTMCLKTAENSARRR
jgi:ribonuclease PH